MKHLIVGTVGAASSWFVFAMVEGSWNPHAWHFPSPVFWICLFLSSVAYGTIGAAYHHGK